MLLPALVTAAVASAASPAGGSADPPDAQRGRSEVYDHVVLRFTTRRRAARTGLIYHVGQRPVGGDAQPPVPRRTRIRLPKGTRIDRGAVSRCMADQGEITSRGVGVCPAASRVGGGTGTAYLGTATQVPLVVSVVNGKDDLLLIAATESGLVLRILVGVVRGHVIDAQIPPSPLPNGREATPTSLTIDVRAAGSRSRPFLRTPRTCPRTGRWRFVYDVNYDDPPGRQRPYDLSRCR